MAEDLVPILAKLHREVVLPDIKRVVEESEHRLRDEMHALGRAAHPKPERTWRAGRSGKEERT